MIQLRRLLIVLLSVFFGNQAYGDHIIGSDMVYVMTSQNANTFTIDVTTALFRDAIQTNVPQEDFVEIAVYRRDGADWVIVPGPNANSFDSNFYNVLVDGAEKELSLTGNICFDSALLDNFQAGISTYTLSGLTLDVIDEDYLIAFQRCCRQDNIINIINSSNTGSVTSILIPSATQQMQNSSPRFMNDPEAIICVGFEQEINISAVDDDGDDIIYSFYHPETAGGPRGGNLGGCAAIGEDQFCVEECDGIFPSPTNCSPSLFGTVNYQVGFDEDNPISSIAGFTIDQSGIISGIANREGVYLLGVVAEEWRAGVKIGETRRDFILTVAACNALAVIGPPNGNVNQYQRECSTRPFQVNAVQNTCGETNVLVENYTNLDSIATPFIWTVFEDDGMTMVRSNDSDWTPTFALGLGRYIAEFAIFPDEICRAYCRYTIEVTESLNLDFDVVTGQACSGDPVSIENISALPPSFSYEWDFGNGMTSSSATPPPIAFSEDGDYKINLIVTDGSCQDSSFEMVNYLAAPQPISINSSSVLECLGTEITLMNDIPNDYTVQWNFGDGNSSTDLTPSHMYSRAGTFDVSLELIAPNTCSASVIGPTIQINNRPDAEFSVVNPAVCTGDPVTVIAPTGSGSSVISYNWDFGNMTSSTDSDPGAVNFEEEGEYVITLTVDDGTCTNMSSQMVNYYLPPDAFTVRPSEFVRCSPADITFDNTLPESSVYSGAWDFGDGSSSTQLSPVHTYRRGGTYTARFQLIAPDGQVCSQEEWPITIIDGPDADFTYSPSPVLNPNETVRFFNQTTPLNAIVQWDFGDGNGSSQDDPTHVFGFPDNYEVMLIAKSNINNCVDTAFAIVPVSSSGAPAYPNAFRPSGEENNEFKGVSLFSAYIDYHLSVWDRWGQKVFETADANEAWNGRKENAGTLLPQGVYIYKAKYSVDLAGEIMEQQTNGTVLLLN